MEVQQLEKIKYPIGPFTRKDEYSPQELMQMIDVIEQAPARYRTLVESLSDEDFKKLYRPGSWNVLQLVHHVADIQLLHLLRMKKALTEPDYNEVTLIDMDAWVTTPDALDAPAEYSLHMLESITKRYVFLLRNLKEEELKISYFHPVRKYSINQSQAINMSAWHLQHHLAHIEIALGRR